MRWSPHEYQLDAMMALASHRYYGLLLSPGSGKTSVTLAVISSLIKSGNARKVFVLSPLRVAKVWQDEAAKWDEFNHLRISIAHGTDKLSRLEDDVDIVVMNFEGLPAVEKKFGRPTFGNRYVVDPKLWVRLGFDMLVIDELSKLKTPSSGRFKIMKKLLPTFGRRVGLTGTPVANGLRDLWGQIYCLDRGEALGEYVTHYRQKYYDRGYQPWDLTLRPGAEEEIYAAIEPIVMRLESAQYTGLPELVYHRIPVQLPAQARKHYLEMEHKFLTEVDDHTITAANAAVKSGKCLQIASGAVYMEDGKSYLELHDEKIAALSNLVDELQGAQLLVAYAYQHEIARIAKALGNVPHIGGGTSPRKAASLIAEWNAGKLPVLLAHPGSCGHGLNLQESNCAHVCFFTPTWDYDLYAQMTARVHRQGNQAPRVFAHHIVAEDTVDELVLDMLQHKEQGQLELFKALADLRRRRLDG